MEMDQQLDVPRVRQTLGDSGSHLEWRLEIRVRGRAARAPAAGPGPGWRGLVDAYLAEAALEAGLRPAELEELAHARAADAALYRAVDTYLKIGRHSRQCRYRNQRHIISLGGGELVDGPAALGDGVLGELAGEDEAAAMDRRMEETWTAMGKEGETRRGLTTGEKPSMAEEVHRHRGVGLRRVEEESGGDTVSGRRRGVVGSSPAKRGEWRKYAQLKTLFYILVRIHPSHTPGDFARKPN
uniref:NPH3 domain-containing protein n=1 Tax=Triticum aestivum TaxID=4565 RepID=A0A077RQH8_WHEAT|nr:unnamed protein product [Triticum aestivum]